MFLSLSLLYSTKYGMYSYEKDSIKSALFLELAAEGGNVLAQLSKGTSIQIGDQHEVNGTIALSTILPAWRLLYSKKMSIFEALYEKKNSEVCLLLLY